MLEQYPRSQIDLQVFVLQADGGYRSAAFNAVSLALMDAGVAMKDFLVATTAGLLQNVAVLDALICKTMARQEEAERALLSVSMWLIALHAPLSWPNDEVVASRQIVAAEREAEIEAASAAERAVRKKPLLARVGQQAGGLLKKFLRRAGKA